MRPRKPPERRQGRGWSGSAGRIAPVGRSAAEEGLSPPMFLMESSTFCPSRRTPMAAGPAILVALRSSRVYMTVPSRISRTMS
jgi:hypothetical protein